MLSLSILFMPLSFMPAVSSFLRIGARYTHATPLSLAGRRIALLRAPFLFEMLDCGIVSPRASIVAGHRAENTTDEVRPVARGCDRTSHGRCAGRRERSSLVACLSGTDRWSAAATRRHAYATVHASLESRLRSYCGC